MHFTTFSLAGVLTATFFSGASLLFTKVFVRTGGDLLRAMAFQKDLVNDFNVMSHALVMIMPEDDMSMAKVNSNKLLQYPVTSPGWRSGWVSARVEAR